jgi:hypothetical protein
MFTTGSKYLYGSAALALVGAFFLALATSGHQIGMSSLTGAISAGYKGPVGDHFGYIVLVGYAGLAIIVGSVLNAVRDGDPESGAQFQGLETAAPVMPVRGSSHWPLVAAFGSAIAVLGLVYSAPLFILGVVVVGIAAIEWTIHSWADHATGDPAANRKARNRMVNPIEIPLFAIVGIALFVFALSRVLLALDKNLGAAVFGIVPAIAFVVAIILNARPKASRNLIAGLVVVGALIVLGGGVAGLVHGPKDVEHREAPVHLYKIKGQSMPAPIDARTAGEESR